MSRALQVCPAIWRHAVGSERLRSLAGSRRVRRISWHQPRYGLAVRRNSRPTGTEPTCRIWGVRSHRPGTHGVGGPCGCGAGTRRHHRAANPAQDNRRGDCHRAWRIQDPAPALASALGQDARGLSLADRLVVSDVIGARRGTDARAHTLHAASSGRLAGRRGPGRAGTCRIHGHRRRAKPRDACVAGYGGRHSYTGDVLRDGGNRDPGVREGWAGDLASRMVQRGQGVGSQPRNFGSGYWC